MSELIVNFDIEQVFSSLRDDNGEPYDPTQYTLEHSSDGNVFLMPTNHTTTANNSRNNQAQEHTDRNPRKRKGNQGKKSGK